MPPTLATGVKQTPSMKLSFTLLKYPQLFGKFLCLDYSKQLLCMCEIIRTEISETIFESSRDKNPSHYTMIKGVSLSKPEQLL
jgi:hypothetical protein